MITEVFNRVEEKFVVTSKQYRQLIYDLSDRLQYDIYNAEGKFYTISNIYYDTPDDRLIRTSLQKPAYKEKLRLRAYGIPGLMIWFLWKLRKNIRAWSIKGAQP